MSGHIVIIVIGLAAAAAAAAAAGRRQQFLREQQMRSPSISGVRIAVILAACIHDTNSRTTAVGQTRFVTIPASAEPEPKSSFASDI